MTTLIDAVPRTYRVADLGRWPDLQAAAGAAGVAWVMTSPIPVEAGERAVLNLYGNADLEVAERVVELVTAHAARILANSALYRSATELAHQLTNALESRGVIDQAKGILMATQGCDADTAFDILRKASQRENRKLRTICEEVVARVVSRGGRPS